MSHRFCVESTIGRRALAVEKSDKAMSGCQIRSVSDMLMKNICLIYFEVNSVDWLFLDVNYCIKVQRRSTSSQKMFRCCCLHVVRTCLFSHRWDTVMQGMLLVCFICGDKLLCATKINVKVVLKTINPKVKATTYA